MLAVAQKSNATRENAEREMTFLGLLGMIDPPRPEAKAAIHTCELAGIKPVMITGDHPLTARSRGPRVGVAQSTAAWSPAQNWRRGATTELEQAVGEIDVYARVSPAHKLRVVTAWQKNGQIVAMTGDGVNDAPALKKADIGVAMGITGTDVSREAAAMTLTDDNFASIVAAVEEGRGIFGNIKKYLMYLLSSNIGEIGLMAGATLAGLPLPLSAVQILYVNLATDGLPALALAVDPPEADLMRRPPRDPRRGIFTAPVVTLMLVGGCWSAVVNLAFRLGPAVRPQPRGSDDDDLRLAGADPVLQGLQFPLRPALRAAAPVCQPVAERRHPLGTDAVAAGGLPALPAAGFRHLRSDLDGLGDRRRPGIHGVAGVGVGQVVRPPPAVAGCLRRKKHLPRQSVMGDWVATHEEARLFRKSRASSVEAVPR